MNRKWFVLWVLVGLVAVVIFFIPIPSSAASPVHRTIRVEAGDFSYNPATIDANYGDRITIELASTDVVHGLFIDGYGLDLISEPGQTDSLTFIADKSGSFRFRCSVTCGDLHPFMIGKLTIGRNIMLWRATGLSLLAVILSVFLYRQQGPE